MSRTISFIIVPILIFAAIFAGIYYFFFTDRPEVIENTDRLGTLTYSMPDDGYIYDDEVAASMESSGIYGKGYINKKNESAIVVYQCPKDAEILSVEQSNDKTTFDSLERKTKVYLPSFIEKATVYAGKTDESKYNDYYQAILKTTSEVEYTYRVEVKAATRKDAICYAEDLICSMKIDKNQ